MTRRSPPSATGGAEPARAFDPSSLSIPVAAKLLGVEESILQRHVDQGFPLNPDGTMNLVHYAAWLNGTDGGNDGA